MMEQKKRKSPLSLTELVILISGITVVVLICLLGVLFAGDMTKGSDEKEIAALRASEVIETCKAYHGDLKGASDKLSGTVASDDENGSGRLIVRYPEDGLVVDLEAVSKDVTDLLVKAMVKVEKLNTENIDEKNPIYTVQAAWQKSSQTAK
ncbi:MAG: hypothetical protein K5639_02375 [Eubacterium sp.]|nr:hypothetical protein [Eubacterium sp.]